MDLVIFLISFDIVASKFLHAYITSYRTVSFQERNPLLRKLFSVLNIEQDVWLSFLFTVLLVGTAVYLLNGFYLDFLYQVLFVFTGLFTTALNLGAAHTAYFGKENFITRRLPQAKKVNA